MHTSSDFPHLFLEQILQKKNHGQNLLPEYCMEVLLHQQCKCHLGDHYFSPAIQSFKFRITAGMRPFPMYGRLHWWFLVLVFRGFPTEDCVISIGFSSVQLVFRICIRVRLNHSRDGTNDHCCIQLWFVSVGHWSSTWFVLRYYKLISMMHWENARFCYMLFNWKLIDNCMLHPSRAPKFRCLDFFPLLKKYWCFVWFSVQGLQSSDAEGFIPAENQLMLIWLFQGLQSSVGSAVQFSLSAFSGGCDGIQCLQV